MNTQEITRYILAGNRISRWLGRFSVIRALRRVVYREFGLFRAQRMSRRLQNAKAIDANPQPQTERESTQLIASAPH